MATHNLGKLQGTPWHVGYVTKKENDPRRHRSRCYYYQTDGSCFWHKHCIGSAHCSEYKDTIQEKQKQEYKEKRKTWQELAPKHTSANIVQLDDVIEIYSFSDKQYYKLDFHKSLNDLPALHKECLGMQIGSIVHFRGEKYKINRKIREDI